MLPDAPNKLAVASSSYDPKNTVVVLVNPSLFKETLEKLANKDYVKLCGDGTFSLTKDDDILLTLGVLTKHYATVAGVNAFRTTFGPIIFAVTNTESEVTYTALFQAACRCAKDLCDLDFATCVRQYHCDWHQGEHRAMQSVLTAASRVGDFAHFIGACVRPKQKTCQDEGHPG